MSGWDIEYHLKSLESYSGRTWVEAPTSLSSAMQDVVAARIAVKSIKLALTLLLATAFVCMGLFVAGVAGGFFGWWQTIGPVVALTLPTPFLLGGAIWARVYLAISVYTRHASRLASKEALYQKKLEESIR